MYIIVSNDITYDQLESNIPESTTPIWSAGTTYAKGAEVRIGYALYTSLIDNNKGNNPNRPNTATNAPWMQSGVTNRGAVLDDFIHTQSVAPTGEDLIVSVPWNVCTGFAAFNLTWAERLTLEILSDTNEVVTRKEYDLLDGVDNWYDYYAYKFSYKREVIDIQFGGFLPGRCRVTLSGSFDGHSPSMGKLMVGDVEGNYATLYGTVSSYKSYTEMSENAFGITTVTRRERAKLFSGELHVPPAQADSLFNLLGDLDGKMCVWLCDNRTTDEGGHGFLCFPGWYEKAELTTEGPNNYVYNISLRGSI